MPPSDIPTTVPATPPAQPAATDPALASPAAVPETPADFGADVIAEFERRSAATAAPADDTEPFVPGEWPSGATDDASRLATRPDAAPSDPDTIPVDPGAGESDAPADASGDAADAGTADADASAEPAGEAPPASPAGDDTPTGYTWTEGDQSVTFDDAAVRQGLVLNQWAAKLPDQTRAAFAAIESGQAVAVPRAELDQFNAWRESQRAAERDADLSNLSQVEPEVAKVIKDLRDELDAVKGQASPVSSQVDPQQQAIINANLTATANAMDQAAEAYRARNGLSEDQMNALYANAVNANIIPAISEQMAVRNPVTGEILIPPDPGKVMEQALDFALVRDPALHTAVIDNRNASTTDPALSPADAAIATKKARAASVASAPSAAVTAPPRTAPLTSQDAVQGMAEVLAAAMQGNG